LDAKALSWLRQTAEKKADYQSLDNDILGCEMNKASSD